MRFIFLLMLVCSFSVGAADMFEDGKIYTLKEDKTFGIEMGKMLKVQVGREMLEISFDNSKMIGNGDKLTESVDFTFKYSNGMKVSKGKKTSSKEYSVKGNQLNRIKGGQTLTFGKIKFSWSSGGSEMIWLYMKKGQKFLVVKK